MPKKVKAKVRSVVEEIAIIVLEDDGYHVREFIEQHSEDDHEVDEVIDIIDVIDEW
jgi:hypothetical protein